MKSFLEQMQRIWGHLGLNQRITLSIAAACVLGGMIGLVWWAHRPSMQLLYGRLGDKDVSEIAAAVQEQGVQYQIGNGGTSIYVPADQVHKLRMVLASKGIPAGEGVGYEIFDRSNFGISDFVQRTNYLRALQGELSRTIAQLHGIRSARVMIVMPENRLLFSDQKAKPTASVFVDTSSAGLPQDNVNAIRFLVANSVEGLRADDVALIDSRGNLLTENLKEDGSLAAASSQMKYRKGVEDYFSSKVETMLAKVLGAGSAVVRVSAEIDTDSTTRTQEVFDPEGQVLRNEQTTEDSTTTTEVEGAAGGAPQTSAVGVSANTPSSTTTDNSKAGKNSEQVRKNKSNTYELNRTTTNAVRAPGAITRLSAAVFIAPKEKPRTPQEIESLRKMVANALGIKAENAQEIARSVTIEETAFVNPPAPKSGGMGEILMNYSDLLKNVGAGIVALGLLFFFLRMLKRTKPDEISFELLQTAGSRVSGSSANITPDLLNEMIRQKPANVGVALRGWMANGSSKS
ncbi:MAG TPA: flagellar basal-body MS-ring/collar protein FliF [Chthoniobacterales bacterium]|jgi:flagellar M-ring protein FliF|nr:flagellar basal-body MS-ring/collar protein FliF [Chthoniobacterales bacterium]